MIVLLAEVDHGDARVGTIRELDTGDKLVSDGYARSVGGHVRQNVVVEGRVERVEVSVDVLVHILLYLGPSLGVRDDEAISGTSGYRGDKPGGHAYDARLGNAVLFALVDWQVRERRTRLAGGEGLDVVRRSTVKQEFNGNLSTRGPAEFLALVVGPLLLDL